MLNLGHHRSAERTNAGFCGVFDAPEPLPYPVFWLIIKQVVMGEDAWVYGLYH